MIFFFIISSIHFWEKKPPFWVYQLSYDTLEFREEVKDLKDLLNNIGYYILREEYDRASSFLNTLLYSGDYNRDTVEFLKSEVFYYNDDFDTSLFYIRRVKRWGEPNLRRYAILTESWIYINDREYRSAEMVLDRIDGGDSKFRCYLNYTYGFLKFKKRDVDSAIYYFKSISHCDSFNLNFSLLRRFMLGRCFMYKGYRDSAEVYMTDIIENHRDKRISLYTAYYWGNYLFSHDDIEGAIYYFNYLIANEGRAIEAGIPMYYVKTTIAQAKYNQAVEMDYQGRVRIISRRRLLESLELYKQSLKDAATEQDTVDARSGISECYKVLIDNTVDITDLESLVDSMIKYIPNDSLMAEGLYMLATKYELLARSYEKDGYVSKRAREFYEKSLTYYNWFVANFPQHRLALDVKIEMLIINAKLERWKDVLRTGELLLQTLPESKQSRLPEIIYILAEAYYLEAGDNREMLERACYFLRKFEKEYRDHPLAEQAIELLRKCEDRLR